MNGREARDATTRVIDIIYYIKQKELETCFFSTDVEKAFDRVNWSFMFQTLKSLGVGERFTTWIKSLYIFPQAQLGINGLLSDNITILL